MACCDDHGGYADEERRRNDEALEALRAKLTGSPSPDRLSAIPVALDELSDAISDLDSAFGGTIQSITPVLGPDTSDTAEPGFALRPESSSSALTDRLRSETRRLREIFFAMQSVNRRIEL